MTSPLKKFRVESGVNYINGYAKSEINILRVHTVEDKKTFKPLALKS